MNWTPFLADWERQALDYLSISDHALDHDRGPEALRRQSLRFPPATETELASLEQRLGRPLPPSYRAFLLSSNGWLQIGMDAQDGRLLAASEVGRFQVLQPEACQAWLQGARLPTDGFIEVPDEEYLVYGDLQDPALIRNEYLPDTIAISEQIDSAIYLLNPRVTAGDEWEAWFFGAQLPGARRYPSFADLMRAERTRIAGDLGWR